MKFVIPLLLLVFLSLVPVRADVPDGYEETEMVKGLKRPCGLAFLPDGRLLIIEQYTGKIMIWDRKTPDTAKLGGQIKDGVYKGHNESGLVGVCVDPAFEKNGFIYTFHTATEKAQRITRWTLKGNEAQDPKTIVDNLPTLGINHNGGGIGFGPDGKLYAGVGENGRARQSSQDLKSLRGKILRYNADGTIPKDNPDPKSPVYAYGFRNPFRFTFQPGTGRLFTTDNGQDDNDEVNIVKPGKNYGWPRVMGKSDEAGLEDPILAFTPTISITGIVFYTGKKMPELQGQFFFCDYNFGNLYRAALESEDSEKVKEHSKFVTGCKGIVDVAVDPLDGYIFYCSLRGGLYRLGPAADKH